MIEHLLSRGLDPKQYTSVYVDDDCTTFLCWNLSGQCVGFHEYNPGGSKRHNMRGDSKYFTYPSWEHPEGRKESRRKLLVWGFETYDPSNSLYVTEGVFDAVSLHNLGLSAVAVCSNDPKHLRTWLSTLANTTVAVLDGDAAGSKLGKFCNKTVICPDGEDANSLAKEQLYALVV